MLHFAAPTVDAHKVTGLLYLCIKKNFLHHICRKVALDLILTIGFEFHCCCFQVLEKYFLATKPSDSSWRKLKLNHIWTVNRDGEVRIVHVNFFHIHNQLHTINIVKKITLKTLLNSVSNEFASLHRRTKS
jgi:hypothetical protein